MSLAIFDLDNTILEGDCELLWSQLVVDQGVEDEQYQKQIDQFSRDYESGQMDYIAYETFFLRTFVALGRSGLAEMLSLLLEQIRPLPRPYILERLDWHRKRGDTILMVTSSNALLVKPIAEMLGISNVICAEVELKDGHPTGKILGTVPYLHGKVTRLKAWLSQKDHSLEGSWGYGDSRNDLPLLQIVQNPVAVAPDKTLLSNARDHGWQILP